MTTQRMVMATDKVEYLVKEMNAEHIKVVSEYEPGWTVIDIRIDTACDIIDIFYAGVRYEHDRAQKELTV